MEYQWFPGHMQKAKGQITAALSRVDVVVELADARIPLSSRNPELRELIRNKKLVLVLNKADLADENKSIKWKQYYKENGIIAVFMNSKIRDRSSVKILLDAIRTAGREKVEKEKKKGILNPKINIMVIGVPNVGKSTFINSLAGKVSARTGNKPGVTVKQQWICVDGGIDLLDTPGVFPRKFKSNMQGLLCAAVGSISDEIIDKYDIAGTLCEIIIKKYPGRLNEKYAIEETINNESVSGRQAIEEIAKKRMYMLPGGKYDLEKSANLLIDNFRNAAIGRMTFEEPEF